MEKCLSCTVVKNTVERKDWKLCLLNDTKYHFVLLHFTKELLGASALKSSCLRDLLLTSKTGSMLGWQYYSRGSVKVLLESFRSFYTTRHKKLPQLLTSSCVLACWRMISVGYPAREWKSWSEFFQEYRSFHSFTEKKGDQEKIKKTESS